jgi:hypothetical protein
MKLLEPIKKKKRNKRVEIFVLANSKPLTECKKKKLNVQSLLLFVPWDAASASNFCFKDSRIFLYKTGK